MNPQLQNRIAAALARVEDEHSPIANVQPISGGCISSAFELTLANGKPFFLKTNANPLPDMFQQEASGLRALAATRTIRVPEVIATHQDEEGDHALPFILMEKIPTVSPSSSFQTTLGQQLAHLHQHPAPSRFGFESNNYIGATPQCNTWSDDWTVFFRDNRLGYQINLANQRNLSDQALNRLMQKLLDILGDIIGEPNEPPCLLHGDLWSGNYLVGNSSNGDVPVLIDPAAHYGRREAELAMTYLFGGFTPDFYAAYSETFPLAEDSARRINVYKLYHLLNHLNLFGSSYHGACVSLLEEIL